MEKIILSGSVLESILFDDNNSEFSCINLHNKFIGVDHDLWEFEAIVQRNSDLKYFKVNWFDNYACNWYELGLDEADFELIEVIPKQVMTTVYE